MTAIVHFIGFRGDEYLSAVRVWGLPHYVHRGWDKRARHEIAPGDTVVFAHGTSDDPPGEWDFHDLDEQWLIPPERDNPTSLSDLPRRRGEHRRHRLGGPPGHEVGGKL